jgi:hypothetical protein
MPHGPRYRSPPAQRKGRLNPPAVRPLSKKGQDSVISRTIAVRNDGLQSITIARANLDTDAVGPLQRVFTSARMIMRRCGETCYPLVPGSSGVYPSAVFWWRVDQSHSVGLLCQGNSEVQKSGLVATGMSKSKRPKFRLFSAQTTSRNGSGPR